MTEEVKGETGAEGGNYSNWEEFLIDSCRFGDIDDIKEALSNGADPNHKDEQGNNALHMAAANGHLEVAKIIAPLVKPETINGKNEAGNTPLHWAVINNMKFLVEFLLSIKADCNVKNGDGDRPLDLAINQEKLELIELIAPFTTPTAEEMKEAEELKEDAAGEDDGEEDEGEDDKAGKTVPKVSETAEKITPPSAEVKEKSAGDGTKEKTGS